MGQKITEQRVGEFVAGYTGFDWLNGEVILFDRIAKKRRVASCILENGRVTLQGPAPDLAFWLDRPVWDWRHTEKTMFIITGRLWIPKKGEAGATASPANHKEETPL